MKYTYKLCCLPIILLCIVTSNVNLKAQASKDTTIIKSSNSASELTIGYGPLINSLSATTVIKPDQLSGTFAGQSIFSVLVDRIAGLRGSKNIRGIGEALVIVDGMPRQLTSIRIEEVESVTFLKDAQASLLFGPEANNGAIVIKTKRGVPGQKRIGISAEKGISSIRRLPKYLGSADYMRQRNKALVYDGKTPQFDEALISEYASGQNPYRYPDVDYYSSDYIKSFRNFNSVVADFSGGNEKASFYSNLGWDNYGSLYNIGEGGNSGSNVFNVRANIDFVVTRNIKGYINGSFIYGVQNRPVTSFWSDASTLHPYYFSPLLPVSLINDEKLVSTAQLIDNNYVLGGSNQYTKTFYGDLMFGGKNQDIERNVGFDYGLIFDMNSLINGLTFRTNLSFDLYNEYTLSVKNQYAVYSPTWNTTEDGSDVLESVTKLGQNLISGEQNSSNEFFSRRYAVTASFDYNRIFNQKHGVSATLLGYYNQLNEHSVIVHEKYPHLGLNANYMFDNKYIAEFNGIVSNSIKLPKKNRGAVSSSVGVGWIISNEGFFGESSTVDFLKLRANAGIMNTDKGIDGYYLYEDQYSIYGSNFTWNDGVFQNRQKYLVGGASLDLNYEKIKNLNIGMEGRFFKNKLYLDANYFITEYADQIVKRSVYPSYLSNNIPFENYNSDVYNGLDASLYLHLPVGNSLSFDIGANLLVWNSKIKKRDETFEFAYQKREGRAKDLIFGLESMGFFKDEEDIATSLPQAFGEVKPGDLKYKDQNNDGKIDSQDAVSIGNSSARFSSGLSLGINYHKFSLFVLGNFQTGSEWILNGDYFWVDGNKKYSETVLNYWTPETAATAKYPRLSSGTNSNNYRTSTFWLRSGNQFNINHVQLSYRFSPKAKWIQNITVYLRGQNILTVMKDDEKVGLNIDSEPALRHFSFGVRSSF